MSEIFNSPDSSEKIYVCSRSVGKDSLVDIELAVLSNFKKLDFGNNPCNDPSDINYNDGQQANPFDKISKYYGRHENVFQFISLLRNEEFSKKVTDLISEKCEPAQLAKFIERVTLYLNRIKQGENNVKEFLDSKSFPDAFFNGYHCGEKRNIYANLNINFTQPMQFLDTKKIFSHKFDAENSALQRVKIYDNGRRAVTINNDRGKRKYNFTAVTSCLLVIKNDKGTLFLDIIDGKVFYMEQEVKGIRTTPKKESEILAEIMNNNEIIINQISLKEVLQKYLNEDVNTPENCVMQAECLPIKCLQHLNNWEPSHHKHFTEPLRKRVRNSEPKTIVCHDMKGGYLEDRFINGTKGEDNYFFLHWPAVDIFIYFSHNCVTIPPCNWISAAHKNGVQVLGTFITEWNEGTKICEKFLEDESSAYYLGMQLVNIAAHCNFDGWLINIENKLKPHQIPILKKFVCFLTEKMHSSCPGSQVIWYDSIIKNGELKWQNALNDLNRMFFTACDGIFLNYNWKEEDLTQSVKMAGQRQSDVYVGVDVFGRGCLGGGGFSTNVAVNEARKFGLSVAIFAPGWVHECLDIKEFKENQFKFWSLLQKYCPPRKLEELPCYSSFCPGFGKKMYRHGKMISNEPWYNLGLQSLQPIDSAPEEGSMELYTKDAYNGGGCIVFSGEISEGNFLNFKVLETNFEIDRGLIVSYTYKPILSNTDLVLVLEVNRGVKLCLAGNNCETFSHARDVKYISPSPKQLILEKGYKWKETIEETSTWISRIYVLNKMDEHIHSVSVKLSSTDASPSPVSVLLGELEIVQLLPKYSFTYRDLQIEWDTTYQSVHVECILEWKYQTSIICSDLYIQIADEVKKYLCTTSQLSYKLEHNFSKLDSFCIILCPQSSGMENLEIETLLVPVQKSKLQ